MFKVGEVTHFYDKIGIAIIELNGNLSSGDRIKFVKNGKDLFEQKVTEIQIGHEKKSSALSGEVVGIKVSEPVSEETEVFRA